MAKKKTNLGRSVYTRADGRIVGYTTIKQAENGQRAKRKYVYGATEREVNDKLNEIDYLVKTGQYMEKPKDTFVAFLWEYYDIKSTKWANTTKELYKMYIEVHFEPYFKDMRLVDIKTMTLDKFYNYKLVTKRKVKVVKDGKVGFVEKDPLEINTVHKLSKFLNSALNYAVANDLIRKNPNANVELEPPKEYEPSVYDKTQFLKLLRSVRGKDEEIPIILGAGCGFRRGEICGIAWSDIDFETKRISIETTRVRFNEDIEKSPKTRKSKRTTLAPDYVIDTLQRYRIAKGNPLGSEKVITRWKPQSLSERFRNLLKEFNLPPTRLHDLRHYNATLMMEQDIPDRVAAERLGHSNITMLRRYQHVLKDMDELAAEKINSTFTEDIAKEPKHKFKIV